MKTTGIAVSMALAIGILSTPPVQADGDADNGAKLFRRCTACHTVEEGKNRVGPSLYNIMGRKAGTVDGFGRYSNAMKESGIVWTHETLDGYLENPKAFMPGNSMAFPGLRKAEDREDVIAFLKRASEDDD